MCANTHDVNLGAIVVGPRFTEPIRNGVDERFRVREQVPGLMPMNIAIVEEVVYVFWFFFAEGAESGDGVLCFGSNIV